MFTWAIHAIKQLLKIFFLQAEQTTGVTPDIITTDKEPALAAAIDEVFGNGAKHHTSKYLNNRMEANHCGTKGRLNVIRGFKDIFSAMRFCTVFEEVRQFFRFDSRRTQRRGMIASRIRSFFNVARAIA